MKKSVLLLAAIFIASCSEKESFSCSLNLNEYKKVEYYYSTGNIITNDYSLSQTLKTGITDCSLAGKETQNSKPQETINYVDGGGLKKVVVTYKTKYE